MDPVPRESIIARPIFRSPEGAVRAFLSALKAKDLDRLNEATALRAQVEAVAKNQPLFKKIFDLSLSESELDEIAKKLEGYQIAGENPPQSTGRVDVILQKADTEHRGGYFRRKVTVRHEKKGWGILDIAGATEFKAATLPCQVEEGWADAAEARLSVSRAALLGLPLMRSSSRANRRQSESA